MTKLFRLLFLLLIGSLAFSLQTLAQAPPELEGAYEFKEGSTRHILIFADDYYVHAAYDQQGKTLKHTEGGLYNLQPGNIVIKLEFDSDRKENVDSVIRVPFTLTRESLEITENKTRIRFTKIDDGSGNLAGTWRISGRMAEGKFSPMPTGARKTTKPPRQACKEPGLASTGGEPAQQQLAP